jgi:hypothetical protein
MVDSVAVLLHQNLVTLQTVAQDGMRVRDSAVASSFRREKTLDQCLSEAEKHLEVHAKQGDEDLRAMIAEPRPLPNVQHGKGQNVGFALKRSLRPTTSSTRKTGLAEFGARMETPQAQAKYAWRAGIAEFPNAECRNRGLTQFRVRSLLKAKAQTMGNVLAHNFNRFCHLKCLKVVMGS